VSGHPLKERRAFAAAVHALAAEPTGANVVSYLFASRNLVREARSNLMPARKPLVREAS
jgi:hypothetical protein